MNSGAGGPVLYLTHDNEMDSRPVSQRIRHRRCRCPEVRLDSVVFVRRRKMAGTSGDDVSLCACAFLGLCHCRLPRETMLGFVEEL